MNGRDNQHLKEHLEAYVLGALEGSEVAQVEGFLAANPEARKEVSMLRKVVALLPLAATPIDPPARVKQQLLSRLTTEQVSESSRSAPPPTPSFFKRARQATGTIVATIVLLLAFTLGAATFSLQNNLSALQATNRRLSDKLTAVQESLAGLQAMQQATSADLAASERTVTALTDAVADDQRALADLNARLEREQQLVTFITAPGVATRTLVAARSDLPAEGEMYMYPGHREAVVIFRGLPRLDPGQVYQFWLANDNGEIAAGMVTVDNTGLARLVVMAPREVNAFTEVMLTVEPAGGSAEPSEQVVLEGSL